MSDLLRFSAFESLILQGYLGVKKCRTIFYAFIPQKGFYCVTFGKWIVNLWGFVKGDIMTYTEKEISYADYVRLRESVNWNNFFKEQTEKCLKNTLYSIVPEFQS